MQIGMGLKGTDWADVEGGVHSTETLSAVTQKPRPHAGRVTVLRGGAVVI